MTLFTIFQSANTVWQSHHNTRCIITNGHNTRVLLSMLLKNALSPYQSLLYRIAWNAQSVRDITFQIHKAHKTHQHNQPHVPQNVCIKNVCRCVTFFFVCYRPMYVTPTVFRVGFRLQEFYIFCLFLATRFVGILMKLANIYIFY